MNTLHDRSDAGVAAIDPSPPSLTGTWVLDPADSSIWFAWPKLRLGTMTGRLHCLGVIRLDDLPPVGAIRFQQPSGLPVLTMALDPASVDTVDVRRHRWWTLRSESLEVLSSGTWRVMATLTAGGASGLVELQFEVDPRAGGPDWLVLQGRGVLDRRAFGIGKPASILGHRVQLHLAVRASRIDGSTSPIPATAPSRGRAADGPAHQHGQTARNAEHASPTFLASRGSPLVLASTTCRREVATLGGEATHTP